MITFIYNSPNILRVAREPNMFLFSPEFLHNVNDSNLKVFNQVLDVNIFLQSKFVFDPVAYTAPIKPISCFDLQNLENEFHSIIDTFVEEEHKDDNQQPFVFIRTYQGQAFAACLRKEDILRLIEDDEAKFYGCLQPTTSYIDAKQMYLKLILFEGAPCFIPKENIDAILESNHVYWLESQHPFLHVPFLAKHNYIDGRGPEMSTFHCQEGTDQMIHLFFPTDLPIEQNPKRIKPNTLTMHV